MSRKGRYLLLLCIVFIFYGHHSVIAEEESTKSAFVVSGGVSLGAYEAGYLYFATAALKADPKRTLRLATGASAGSVNSLISLINYCTPDTPNPRHSLGWKAWIPQGYKELFVEKAVTSLSVFSRKTLQTAANQIWTTWKNGLSADCDVLLAVTTTQFDPVRIKLAAGLTAPRQGEKFTLRIRGRGPGKPPQVENHINPNRLVPQAKLHLIPDNQNEDIAFENFQNIKSLLFASTAFPVAFRPQRLKHCIARPNVAEESTGYCQGESKKRFFVDGGVFDNNPLRLGIALAEENWGGERDAPTGATGDSPDKEQNQESWNFVYLDPDTRAYPTKADSPITAEKPRVLAMMTRLLKGFISSARAQELYELAETKPGLEKIVNLTRAHFPPQSELLGAFMGFFEKDFRIFDFYLGMHDAFLENPGDFKQQTINKLQTNPPADWEPFACMVGWFEEEHLGLRKSCKNVDRNFRVMLQIAMDRVYRACADVSIGELPENPTELCQRAAQGDRPRVMSGLTSLNQDFKVEPTLSKFDFVMQLFTLYGFQFKDLGLSPNQAKFGRIRIRRKLLKMARQLAKAQPVLRDRILVETAARASINSIAYEPPRNLVYGTAGTSFEIGASVLPFDWNKSYLRFNVALQFPDLIGLVVPNDTSFKATPLGGVEFRLPALSNPIRQFFFGVRGGYQLGITSDRLGTRGCTTDRANNDNRNCSQVVFQNYLAATALDRVRAQITFEYFPKDSNFDNRRKFNLFFGLGFQLY